MRRSARVDVVHSDRPEFTRPGNVERRDQAERDLVAQREATRAAHRATVERMMAEDREHQQHVAIDELAARARALLDATADAADLVALRAELEAALAPFERGR